MALEATHIKFALDLKDKYQIGNLDRYISGSIYPDSRYISGIDRKLTHNDDLLSPEFLDDDFKKGWSCHFLCDTIGNEVANKQLPELFVGLPSTKQGNESWVTGTAVKIIQDINIFSQFDIKPYLEMLGYAENPNNEPIEKVKEYNQMIQRMYGGKDQVTVEDAAQMWLEFGIEQDLVDMIVEKSEEFLADDTLTEKIKELYKEIVALGIKRT